MIAPNLFPSTTRLPQPYFPSQCLLHMLIHPHALADAAQCKPQRASCREMSSGGGGCEGGSKAASGRVSPACLHTQPHSRVTTMAGTQQLERSATEQLGAGPAPPELRQLAERANAALAKGQQQLAAEQGEAAGWEPRRSCRPRLRSEAIASLPQQLVLLLARQSSCGAAVSLTAPPAADRRFPMLCRRRRCRHRRRRAFCLPPEGMRRVYPRLLHARAPACRHKGRAGPRRHGCGGAGAAGRGRAHPHVQASARRESGCPALECCTVLP